jgi:hypothetical protein
MHRHTAVCEAQLRRHSVDVVVPFPRRMCSGRRLTTATDTATDAGVLGRRVHIVWSNAAVAVADGGAVTAGAARHVLHATK